jgi:2',3'-cyclic-nucleotide 2'-phosphodiesterase (5'-nucleotidase family)
MRKMKFLLVAVLAFVLAFAVTAPIAVSANAPEGSVTITILHTNDMHGRFVTGSLYSGSSNNTIGVDRIAAILAETDNAILVDAGDTTHGTPFVNETRGAVAIEMMNMAGYSFFTPGNHDFNYDISRLLELEEMADFAFLSANIVWEATGEFVFNAYEIVEIAGVKVGFFGLTTQYTTEVTRALNILGLSFLNPVAAAEKAVVALQAAGAEVIVAVTHLGSDDDDRPEAIDVAQGVAGIDVIIDGHSHSRLPEGRRVGNTLVAQAHEYALNVGVVEIVVLDGAVVSTSASWITFEAAQAFTPVAEITERVDEILEELEEIYDVVIGYSPIFISGDRNIVRFEEGALGNLVTDAMRWVLGTDIAFMNGGGIRADLPAGEITGANGILIFPFANYTVILEITPAQLWQLLEIGVQAIGNGRFPQISGFSFVFDGDAPPLERVVSVTMNGVALDKNDNTTILTFATNNFLAEGNDGYTLLKNLPVLFEGDLMCETLVMFINTNDISNTAVEGRIVNTPGVLAVPVVEEDDEEEADEVVEVDEAVAEAVTLPALLPLDEIARQVINGDWGNNPERARRLTEAGYDARAVQARVNQILA